MPIGPRHPAWIGAWWLGFVVFGVLAVVTPVPLLCFPRRLKPRTEDEDPINHDTHHGYCFYLKDLLRTLFRTINNATYLLTLLSLAFMLMAIASVVVFMPKYLENQFSIPAWKANATYAGLNVLVVCIGTIAGGIVVSKAKLSPVACMRLVIVLTLAGMTTLSFGILFGCDNVNLAGFNNDRLTQVNTSSCYHSCGCHGNMYFPVCGSDGINYMSPCHAGCSEQQTTVFSSCSCISENGTAEAGLCKSKCNKMAPYMAITALTVFFISFGKMSYVMTLIRSVKEEYKGVAIGFASLTYTFLGWFLSPILMGKLIDTTCLHWHASCEGRGACALYNNTSLRIRFHMAVLVICAISMMFMLAAYCTGRKKTDWSGGERKDSEDTGATKAMLDEDARTPCTEDWDSAKESII